MRSSLITLAALALAAGLAAAQSDQTTPTERSQPQGAEQTYDTGQTGADVEKAKDTAKMDDYADARKLPDDPNEPRSGGAAASFIAAGLGMALLGLFVRRRNRRYGKYPGSDRPDGGTPRGPRF